jgi:hypothetical protein
MLDKSYRCPGARERCDWIVAEMARKARKNRERTAEREIEVSLARSKDGTCKTGGISTERG